MIIFIFCCLSVPCISDFTPALCKSNAKGTFLARLDEVKEELLYYPGVSSGTGVGVGISVGVGVGVAVGKMLNFLR